MEDYFGTVLPETDYGLAKYVMNSLCRQSKNIYNLRIFGCYGPTDAGFKLITYVIRRCMEQATIELNKDCKYAVVLGNEVKGVQQSVVDKCDQSIEIPQFGTKHSLNVSVTAGLVIWDFFKMLR